MDELDLGGVRKHLEDEFGIVLPQGKIFANDKKVFLYTGKEMDFEGRYGLYLGSIEHPFRPSVYSSQLATKGFVEVNEKEAKEWMCGLDIKKNVEGNFVLIKFGKYILGPGKPREGKILNNLPKNRRLPLSSL